jgi:hypothetical protein
MPGMLLNFGSMVQCAHGGRAQPTAIMPRVRIMNQPAVVQTAPYAVSGCPFVAGTSPLPCLFGQWTTAALRVRIMGNPVLLQDSQATTVPNGVPLTVLQTQMRVKGM